MANRFWGDAPIAEYSPMSMQEMMIGPQTMYNREQELKAQVDAMNESQMTLKAALGDAAPVQDGFSSKYQELLGKISKSGATPQLMEEARNLKKTYINEVVPVESFAKARQQAIDTHAKLSMDGSKIVVGAKPSDISFEQWKKNPGALESFKAVDKGEIGKMSVMAGKNLQSQFGGVDDSMVQRYGILGVVTGAKSIDDHNKKMVSDEVYRDNFNKTKEDIAASQGVDLLNKDVDAFITSNIVNNIIGNVQPIKLTKEEMQQYVGKDAPGLKQGDPMIVKVNETAPMPSPKETPLKLAHLHPGVKAEAERYLSSISNGKYKTIEALDKDLNAPDVLGDKKSQIVTPYGVTASMGSIDQYSLSKVKAEAKQYEKVLNDELLKSPMLNGGLDISFNNLMASYVDNKIVKDEIETFQHSVNQDINYRMQEFEAADKNDADFWQKVKDGVYKVPSSDPIKVLGLQVRGFRDPGSRQYGGVGDYNVRVAVPYRDKDNKEQTPKVIRLSAPRDFSEDVVTAIGKWAMTTGDADALTYARKAMHSYDSTIKGK